MSTRDLSPVDLKALEGLLDSYGLTNLVCGLITVVHMKADHIRAKWRDDTLARLWDRAAYRLAVVAHTWGADSDLRFRLLDQEYRP